MKALIITAVCFVVCAVFASRVFSPDPRKEGTRVESQVSDGGRRVTLSPAGLYYYEGDNSLRLTVEMGSDARGAFYYVYVWTATTWIREMPEWCRYRRDEVLAEIRRLTADRRIKWIEED
jgi:hypothetical protein